MNLSMLANTYKRAVRESAILTTNVTYNAKKHNLIQTRTVTLVVWMLKYSKSQLHLPQQ